MFLYSSWNTHTCSFLLDLYLEMERLGHRMSVCASVVDRASQISEAAVWFTSHQRFMKFLFSLPSPQHLPLSVFLLLVIWTRVTWGLTVAVTWCFPAGG